LRALDPLPAVVLNARYDMLAENDAYVDLFMYWHSMPCVQRNTLWCCLTEPAAREKFLEYDEHVRYLVARYRAGYARHVGEPEWEEDIRRLSGLSSEFTALWARQEVAESRAGIRTFTHPDAGALRFTTSELQLHGAPEVHLVVYTPADDDTRERLPLTRG
jgi:hypothetical protein